MQKHADKRSSRSVSCHSARTNARPKLGSKLRTNLFVRSLHQKPERSARSPSIPAIAATGLSLHDLPYSTIASILLEAVKQSADASGPAPAPACTLTSVRFAPSTAARTALIDQHRRSTIISTKSHLGELWTGCEARWLR